MPAGTAPRRARGGHARRCSRRARGRSPCAWTGRATGTSRCSAPTAELVAGGGSPDGQEIAQGWTLAPGTLTVQACRRSGTGAAELSVAHEPLVGDAAQARANAPQLVSVEHADARGQGPARRARRRHDRARRQDRPGCGPPRRRGRRQAARRRLHAGACWSTTSCAETARAKTAATPAVAHRRCRAAATSYRKLVDYETELKTLAAENPGLVRLITLPEQDAGEGRDGARASRSPRTSTLNDGKPAFLNMGVHHAREWPAGELTMEWAYELINGYKAGDPRATQHRPAAAATSSCRSSTRTASTARAAPALRPTAKDEAIDDTVYIIQSKPSASTGARTAASARPTTALLHVLGRPGGERRGPEPQLRPVLGRPRRRTATRSTQTYRGPAPFSEPESRNIQWLVSRNQVTTLITNHTTAGLVLRAPGLAAIGDPVDEHRGYKALGDAMAKRERLLQPEELRALRHHGHDRGLELQRHRRLRLHVRALLRRAQLRRPATATTRPSTRASRRWSKEWDGTSAQADHGGISTARATARRSTSPRRARSTKRATRCSRAWRSGRCPRCTLTKDFKTDAFEGAPNRSTTTWRPCYDVGASGAFRWHVNPSTRPVVAKGSANPGTREPGAERGRPVPRARRSARSRTTRSPCRPTVTTRSPTSA